MKNALITGTPANQSGRIEYRPPAPIQRPHLTGVQSVGGEETAGGSAAVQKIVGNTASKPGRVFVEHPELAIANEKGGMLFLDTRTGKLTRRIEKFSAAGDAFGAAASPDGRLVYATDKGTEELLVLDRRTFEVKSRISFDAASDPHQPIVSLDGKNLFVPLNAVSKVAAVDLTSNPPKKIGELDTGPGTKPHILALSPDGKTAVVSVQSKPIGDTKTRGLSSLIAFEPTPEGMKVPRTYPTIYEPRVVAASNDAFFYAPHGAPSLMRIDKATGKETAAFLGAFGPPGTDFFRQVEGVAVSSDGKTIALTHEGRNELTILREGKDVTFTAVSIRLPAKPYWVEITGNVAVVTIPGVEPKDGNPGNKAMVMAFDTSVKPNKKHPEKALRPVPPALLWKTEGLTEKDIPKRTAKLPALAST